MMKVCQNCETENPADAVFCSSCGMGLTGAAMREEAGPVDTTDRDGRDGLHIARFMWGWVLLSVGVPGMLCSACTGGPNVALAGMLDSGLGAWMVWSVARRRGRGDDRIWRLVCVLGPLMSVTAAGVSLGGAFLDLFVGMACAEGGGGDCVQLVETLTSPLLGALVAAPLVGGILVVVEWLWRWRRSAPTGESQPGV